MAPRVIVCKCIVVRILVHLKLAKLLPKRIQVISLHAAFSSCYMCHIGGHSSQMASTYAQSKTVCTPDAVCRAVMPASGLINKAQKLIAHFSLICMMGCPIDEAISRLTLPCSTLRSESHLQSVCSQSIYIWLRKSAMNALEEVYKPLCM